MNKNGGRKIRKYNGVILAMIVIIRLMNVSYAADNSATYESIETNQLYEVLKSGEDLIINGTGYTIVLKCEDIVNPNNELKTVIAFSKEGNKLKFEINDGESLPGKITITLSDEYFDYKYLYLYSNTKDKYQRVKYEPGVNTMVISNGGSYIMTKEIMYKFHIDRRIMWAIGIVFFIGIAIYIIYNRKYWFW